MDKEELALVQTIADLEYVRGYPGVIDMLLEKRREELEKVRKNWRAKNG